MENQDIGNGCIGIQIFPIPLMSISDTSIAKNGHIGLDISEI
jgi:hypothetical protein